MPRIRTKIESEDTTDWAAPRGPTFYLFYLWDSRLGRQPILGSGFTPREARHKARMRWFAKHVIRRLA